jgi:hypothetical protein
MPETSVIVLILLIITAFLITSPKNYPIILLTGLIGAAIFKCSTKEDFESSPLTDASGQDGDDTDMNRGTLTSDFDNSESDSKANIKNGLDNSDAINRLFQREPETADGDQRIYDQMKNVAQASKQATLNRTRFTSENFKPLLQEELDEQEKRIWWEDETLEHKMVKDGVDFD